MPIEFKCARCARLLRVPDGSSGKACECPGCKERLIVPNRSGLDQETLSVRIDVPCPKCKNILECDAALDGTRGCCPACSYVFTISMDAKTIAVSEQSESFPFACPMCKQLFEGTPDKEGKKGKCTQCSAVFVIERYVPPKPKPKPILESRRREKKGSVKQPKTVRDGTTPNAKLPPARPVAQPELTQSLDLSHLLPPMAANYAAPTYYVPQNAPMAVKRTRQKSSKNRGSKIGWILAIVGGMLGLGLLICCGGIGLLLWNVNRTNTITAGGFSVDAQGIINLKTKFPDNFVGQEIDNLFTRSEFVIGTTNSSNNQLITPEMFYAGIHSAGGNFQAVASTVTRAGLTGYRFKSSSELPVLIECYQLGNGLLILMYGNGPEIATTKGSRVSTSIESAMKRDNPEAFFASLRRNP